MTELTRQSTEVSWTPRPGLTYEEWQETLYRLLDARDRLQFLIGDCLNAGDDLYGEDAAQALDPERGDYIKLSKWKWVARSVKPSTRVPNLSWSHHRLVAKFSDEAQRTLLGQAIEYGFFNVVDFRNHIEDFFLIAADRTPRTIEPTIATEDDEYIVGCVTRRDIMEVEDRRHLITYRRWPTTTGLTQLPALLTKQEHMALLTYINSSGDAVAWQRGDYMIQIENEANHRARLENWKPERYTEELAAMYQAAARELNCSPKTLRLNEKTARMFHAGDAVHPSLRIQTARVGYEHHELLARANRSRPEAMDYLDRVQRDHWTTDQLKAELHLRDDEPSASQLEAELTGGRA